MGPCLSREGAGIQQVESMELGSQQAQHPENAQNPKHADRNMAEERGQLQLPEPSSAATTTFDLLMIPCQIKLDVPKSHRNTKCHVFSSLMHISP